MNLKISVYQRKRTKTEIAAIKFKHIMAKVGQETAKASRDIIVNIASETAKKILLGQNT